MTIHSDLYHHPRRVSIPPPRFLPRLRSFWAVSRPLPQNAVSLETGRGEMSGKKGGFMPAGSVGPEHREADSTHCAERLGCFRPFRPPSRPSDGHSGSHKPVSLCSGRRMLTFQETPPKMPGLFLFGRVKSRVGGSPRSLNPRFTRLKLPQTPFSIRC
jgi:hypothetical protein